MVLRVKSLESADCAACGSRVNPGTPDPLQWPLSLQVWGFATCLPFSVGNRNYIPVQGAGRRGGGGPCG